MSLEVLAIVQARSSSKRLPRKVLAPILGEPMIVRQLERVSRSRLIDQVVVATSTDASDDDLADQLRSRRVFLRRGPLEDVFSRFSAVVSELRPAHIVRLTADCPLADPEVIDLVIKTHIESGADYTSNSMDRTFPHGLDVECVTAEAFQRLSEIEMTQQEREHVTMGIYSRPQWFSLRSVTQPEDASMLRWTVDYPNDLDFVRLVYEALYPHKPSFTTADIHDYLKANPENSRMTSDV